MKWLLHMALKEARFTRFRGAVMLFSMVFGLTVLVSFSSIKQGFHENFYRISTILTGGDLRIEIVGEPTERMRRLLPKLGDRREAFWGARVDLGDEDSVRKGMVWFRQANPETILDIIDTIEPEWPETLPLEIVCTKEQAQHLQLSDHFPVQLNQQILNVETRWTLSQEELLPLWIKRIKRSPIDRLAGNTILLDQLLLQPDLKWEQVWTFHFDEEYADDRIKQAKYILDYLHEENQGVRFIHELPDETGFYYSFQLISNTLFLAAFSALMLGTLAYTVTFIDFSRGKTQTIALMRVLGCTMMEAWGVYGAQVIIYALLSVILAGGFSVGIQLILPQLISMWTGVDLQIEIYWSALFVSLAFGGCFILFPGLIAIMQLINCEPIEVLRSVKMPAQRVRVRWIQIACMAITFILAIIFCLQMVEDYGFAIICLGCMGAVFGLLLLGVLGLRKSIRKLTQWKRTYPMAQASANLFRTENQYTFTLTSISFGLFLITFLFLFFEGFARKGIHEIAGYGSISDDRVGLYLEWLQHVFFINQWMGVTLLIVGVLAVLVLLTSQRRTRLYESVVLETLGADAEMIRRIMIYESIFAGCITAILGLFGGLVFGGVVLVLFLHLPFVFPIWILMILFIGTVAVMIAMGFFNMKGIIGYPPLEVLRRRRHFSNW